MECLAEARSIQRDRGDAALEVGIGPLVQFFLHPVRAVEDDDDRMRPLAGGPPQITADPPLAEVDLERAGRVLEVRRRGGIRPDALRMQLLLARRIHEHDVLREVVGRARPEPVLGALPHITPRVAGEGVAFVPVPEAFPLVGPALEARDAAEDIVQIGGRDAVVRELQLGPGRHLPGQAEPQRKADEAGPQELPTQHVRHQQLDPSTLDLHRALARGGATGLPSGAPAASLGSIGAARVPADTWIRRGRLARPGVAGTRAHSQPYRARCNATRILPALSLGIPALIELGDGGAPRRGAAQVQPGVANALVFARARCGFSAARPARGSPRAASESVRSTAGRGHSAPVQAGFPGSSS